MTVDGKDTTKPSTKSSNVEVVSNTSELLQYGVIQTKLNTDTDHGETNIDWKKYAEEFSTVNPLMEAGYGDNEYAFYRSILDDEEFPFDVIFKALFPILRHYFLEKDTGCVEEIMRLDDAFCIHYNTSQEDTRCEKHVDPSDVTVNICLDASDDMEGSEVKFYGTRELQSRITHNAARNTGEVEVGLNCDRANNDVLPSRINKDWSNENGEISDYKRDRMKRFLVGQVPGCATIHWGQHPHETMPLTNGYRTNIVLTYVYIDDDKSKRLDTYCDE